MFDWLQEEIAAVRTPRFHLVEGPADEKLKEGVFQSEILAPVSYREFVLRFGNTKLYRLSRSGYRIGIFAAPRETILEDGTHLYHLGFHDGARVYVKPERNLDRLPIFEFEAGSEEKVADDFSEWLEGSCARARKKYGKKKWGDIMRGPKPFTPEEQELVEVRRRIRWRVLGFDDVGDHIFEVTNTGNRTLQVLTVGVRSKDGRLNGAVLLNICPLHAGLTAILHVDCYKNLVSSAEVEIFSLPDPEPEDREFYSEFRYREI
ncbi:MAG TPA: hypothetical protein VKZ53_11220 [Candidatus Angelobacter sp.]|nr:hypothetical protein [Candidatus Angelobacter sp.]